MKRFKIYVAVSAVILAALAFPAAAQHQVPFKGTFQGDDHDSNFTSTTVDVDTAGTGIGTHLGQFLFTQHSTVTFADGTDVGSAHFIAANGDTLDRKSTRLNSSH